jgi:hypothetical protein
MFFYGFLSSNVAMLANQNILQAVSVTANGTSYNITTSNYYAFQTQYGAKPQTVAGLQSMGCVIDNYQGAPIYSSTAYNNSPTWIIFLICSLISMGRNLIIKSLSWFSKSSKSTFLIKYEL